MDDKRKLNKRVATTLALTHVGEDNEDEDQYEESESQNDQQPGPGVEIAVRRKKKKKKKKYIKFFVLSLSIFSKSSSLIDEVTDMRLLWKASNNGAILFTMVLFVCILAPYILSYSSGIELWLHRRTFEHLKPFTFKSILLALYLFPTGILYFIIVDLVDIVVEMYKWFAFNIIYCCKREEELVLIESSVARVFGMSRMNWISFKKQKRISQLFFETIPQVTLQCLIYFQVIKGANVSNSGITNQDLMISIASAGVNSMITIFKLYAESVAVEESFVRYALTNITARYSWVPFTHKIHKFFNDNLDQKKVSSRKYLGIRMITKKDVLQDQDDNAVKIRYNIKYRYPLITCLVGSVTGKVDYDFSTVSIETFIAVLKSYRKVTNGAKLNIYYGDSLRLLGVKDIIKLMQCCSDKDIYLPDIALVDWELAFANQLKNDVRLFCNHFDEWNRPLLISLYLTGYDNIDFSILRAFVSEFDVPINIADDDGNTLMHHMIINSDIKALRALRASLKFNQRLHLSEMNNLGETVMHLALEHDLKVLAKAQKSKSPKAEHVITEEKEASDVERKVEEKNDYQYAAADDDDLLDGFESVWLEAVQKNDIKDVNYIHPQTLINFLHLKVNRTAVPYIQRHDEDRVQELKQITVSLYKQYNHITAMQPVEIIDANHVFALKKADVEDESAKKTKINKKLIHSFLLNDFANININAVIYNNQTTLGFVLLNFIDFDEYFSIAYYLLNHGAILLASEISSFAPLFVNAASRSKCYSYFNLFDQVIKKSNIKTQSVLDADKNNPLHIAIMAKRSNVLNDNRDTGKYIEILSNLCNRYPEWLQLTNNDKNTPVEVAINNNDVDATVCLYRSMTIATVLSTERKTVNSMILMGNYLLSKKQGTVMHLLLKCLQYIDFWYWPSQLAHSVNFGDRSNETEWISLVNYVSKQTHKKTIADILIAIGALSESHMKEYEGRIETGDASKGKKDKKKVQNNDADDEKDDIKEEENVIVDEEENIMAGNAVIAPPENEEEQIPKEPINWLEVAYSTVVETFSFLDLYTDLIIFDQLYRSNNMWWTTWMLMLLIAPYLVSYGSLATIFQNNISYVEHPIKSIFILFMMTPLALLYLLAIDVVFIIYALLSTFLFLTTCTKVDIREAIDRYVFERIFNMNRTEVVGYRRLRTLSQLFFETIPQILLQLRILWVIEWEGDDSFAIDEQTIIWSVSLAFSHLLLENGIIYLDSKALRMDFFEYSMVCLGGRVHWVPFQHLINEITSRQVYIYYNIDDEESNFNVNKCKIEDAYETPENMEDYDEFALRRRNRLVLDYEAISADVNCFQYPVTYQFSSKAMQKLSERLTNCSTLQIPETFHISDANAVLHSVMKNVFCCAQINLGYNSVGNVDIFALCHLYEACGLNKIRLNIPSINKRTVNKMISNTSNKQKISVQITESLIKFGEISAIQWIHKDPDTLPYSEKQQILNGILDRCLSANKDMFIRIDILRKCYKHKCFIGRDCKIMQKILAVIDKQYAERCKYNDAACCFAVIFILLYTKGHVLFSDCVNGCCSLDGALKSSIARYLPTMIEIDDTLSSVQIPFELFDCCLQLNEDLESIVLNHFKSYMINATTVNYIAHITDTLAGEPTQTQIDAVSAAIQIDNGTASMDDLKECDQVINNLQVMKTQIYLKNTYEHRSFHNNTKEIVPDIAFEMKHEFEHRFKLEELLPSRIDGNTQFASIQIELKDFQCDIDDAEEVAMNCSIYYCDNNVTFLNEVHLINKQIKVKPDSAVINIAMNSGLSSLNDFMFTRSQMTDLVVNLSTVSKKDMRFSALVFKIKYWNLGKDDLGAGYLQLNISDNSDYFIIDDELNKNKHNYVIQIPIKARFHFFPAFSDFAADKDVVQFGIQSVCVPDSGTGHAASLVLEQSSKSVLSKQSIRYDHDGEIVNKPANERPRVDRFEFGDIVHAEVVFSKKTMEYFVNGKSCGKTPIVFSFPWHFAMWKKRPSANCKIVVIQDEFMLNKLRSDYKKSVGANAMDQEEEDEKESGDH